jgi:hypothetical protein
VDAQHTPVSGVCTSIHRSPIILIKGDLGGDCRRLGEARGGFERHPLSTRFDFRRVAFIEAIEGRGRIQFQYFPGRRMTHEHCTIDILARVVYGSPKTLLESCLVWIPTVIIIFGLVEG